LTVAEFERLRAAAKKDRALATVLEKLTNVIEVDVTFK